MGIFCYALATYDLFKRYLFLSNTSDFPHRVLLVEISGINYNFYKVVFEIHSLCIYTVSTQETQVRNRTKYVFMWIYLHIATIMIRLVDPYPTLKCMNISKWAQLKRRQAKYMESLHTTPNSFQSSSFNSVTKSG